MKIKCLYIIFVLIPLILFGWMLFAHDKAQTLKNQFVEMGFFPQDIITRTISTNLSGQALILYDFKHPNYPQFQVQRGQFQNNDTSFNLSLRGIQGSLFEYLNQHQAQVFQKQLNTYNPISDLLTDPFVTLAILGENMLDLDIIIKGMKTAPNQIILDIIIYQNNQQKIHFTTKFSPKQNTQTLWDSIKTQSLTLQLAYICPEWKKRLDDYSLSKNRAFVTEEAGYKFNF